MAQSITLGQTGDAGFVLTLAVCADPLAIDAWVEGAAEGDVFEYARGVVAPSRRAGFAHARVIEAQGMVALRQRRLADGVTSWWLVRSGIRPATLAAPVRPAVRLGSESLTDGEAELLMILKRKARRGGVMPVNRALADAAGLRTAVAASNAIKKLVRLGLIAVEHRPSPELRKVTIL